MDKDEPGATQDWRGSTQQTMQQGQTILIRGRLFALCLPFVTNIPLTTIKYQIVLLASKEIEFDV